MPVTVATLAGVAAGLGLEANFFDTASSELIAFLALIMAGVLPTVVLTATIPRAGGLSV